MFTKDNASQYGRKGGLATVKKHGPAYMAKIGRKGFEATTAKYFGGDESAHRQWMAEKGAWNYFVQTGLPNSKGIFRRPRHPAHQHEEIPF